MTTGADGSRGARQGRAFYVSMAAVVILVVIAGFGPTYSSSLAPPGLPFWVHLHGALMVGWIALFATQAWLVRRRALSLHRRLGWASTALAAAIVPMGFATTMLAVQRGATPPFFTPAQMMAADMVDVCLFAGLYIAAVLKRRESEWHKRLLLCATVLLTWPAIGRLIPLRALGLEMIIPAASVLLVLLALVGPIYDLVTRRRIHPAYLWGVGIIVLAQPLHLALAASPPLVALAQALQPAGS